VTTTTRTLPLLLFVGDGGGSDGVSLLNGRRRRRRRRQRQWRRRAANRWTEAAHVGVWVVHVAVGLHVITLAAHRAVTAHDPVGHGPNIVEGSGAMSRTGRF